MNHKSNSYFEEEYTKQIAPLYGNIRNNVHDSTLLQKNSNIIPHDYSILNRENYTDKITYSIDPDGCEDADDAFSIYYDSNNRLYLAIHIADPTEEININSPLWRDIVDRVITRYPSNNKPIHLMPKVIVDKSSLMENKYGNEKNAITVLTEINVHTYEPCGNIRLLFTKVSVKKSNAFTYKNACDICETDSILITGLKISDALIKMRAKTTLGVKLNEINPSYIDYSDVNCAKLINVDKTELSIKHMIAEFAIFANTFVGEYLKIHMEEGGIFRACNAQEWLSTMVDNISGEELLNSIIVNGIQAEYIRENASHDLVGKNEYSHFTSPIRRLSDCISHYLLKYIHLKQNKRKLRTPFTKIELDELSEKCLSITKNIKKVQYRDTKFRLIQVMNNMLLYEKQIYNTFFITSYKSPFLNLIICKIGDTKVHMSYTIRMKKFIHDDDDKTKHTLLITVVNCLGKFDAGSIPELDKYVTTL